MNYLQAENQLKNFFAETEAILFPQFAGEMPDVFRDVAHSSAISTGLSVLTQLPVRKRHIHKVKVEWSRPTAAL